MKAVMLLSALMLAAFAAAPMGTAEVIGSAADSDWRPLSPEATLYMDTPTGLVLIELNTTFAPRAVTNIRRLVRQGYFDGISINRVQENYVVQWGDAETEDATARRPLGRADPQLPPEFERGTAGLAFDAIPGPDGYADTAGFSNGFAAARTGERAWLAHCYGALGVGRGDTADSGNGSELYVVIGHAPRHLDRNITIAGRVILGMENLTSLPRGTGPLGFYTSAEQRVPIRRIRIGSDVPTAERMNIQIMRTDSETFKKLIDARRHRTRDGWFLKDAGHVDLCNVRVPHRKTNRP